MKRFIACLLGLTVIFNIRMSICYYSNAISDNILSCTRLRWYAVCIRNLRTWHYFLMRSKRKYIFFLIHLKKSNCFPQSPFSTKKNGWKKQTFFQVSPNTHMNHQNFVSSMSTKLFHTQPQPKQILRQHKKNTNNHKKAKNKHQQIQQQNTAEIPQTTEI